MSIKRALTTSNGHLADAGTLIAGTLGYFGLKRYIKSKVPKRIDRHTVNKVVTKDTCETIVRLLAPMIEGNLKMYVTKIDGRDVEFIKTYTPYVIHEIVENAYQGISICDYYDAGNGLFSLMITDGRVSMESFWTGPDAGAGWKFFLGKQPIMDDEALVVYRSYVRAVITAGGINE